ncbi:MAG: S9 family peptidase [Janthinobacterium lividum]
MTNSTLTPPVAQIIPKTDTLHGDTRIDNYFWMREKSDAEVTAYLEAENAYSDAVLAPTATLQETLYTEMKGRIQETDLSVPYRLGEYFYYSRTEEGQQYPIACRKKGSLDALEEITLDLNLLAEGHSYLGLGAYAVSDDGNLLAYSTDVTGFRQYTLQVKDLRTGELLPDKVEKTISVVWAADNKTLFYTTEDDAKRSYRLYRHTLGGAEDALIYEEKDALFSIHASRSRSKGFVFLTSESSKTTEVLYLASIQPEADWTVFRPRETDHRYYVDHHGEKFFVRTDKDAKNFRIVSAPLDAPSDWTEFIPYDPAITREDMDFFTQHAVISEREGGLEQLRVIDLTGTDAHKITFPEPSYTVSLDTNPEFDTTVLRYRYQSQITPASVYDYDMNTQNKTLLKQTPVLGGYDPQQYVAERIQATASDGTCIPISLVYKRGLEKNGEAPLLLYGYGSYGISMPASFSSNRLSLLDRGMVFAVAHIRGGGDLGEDWREAGKLHLKLNTFTDFIACAEFLIAEKYTSPNHLAIQGGSAGGLLMGATTNLRPDLFHAVLSQVPFVDVLNTMLDDTLPLTVGEYLEWGNPNVKADYDYMRTYCPYTNIEAKSYPAMLVKTSLNDSQVMYWEAAKYTAKLRAHKTDSHNLLLKTNMGAGHGGSSGRYDALKETAFDYAFLLTQLRAA